MLVFTASALFFPLCKDMRKLFLIILIIFLFAGNIFSQKIGIVYNTDEWVEFAYLRGVAYRIENEYRSDLSIRYEII